jgi:hypothetical protein
MSYEKLVIDELVDSDVVINEEATVNQMIKTVAEKVVEPGGIEPPTVPCEGTVIPLNYGPTGR